MYYLEQVDMTNANYYIIVNYEQRLFYHLLNKNKIQILKHHSSEDILFITTSIRNYIKYYLEQVDMTNVNYKTFFSYFIIVGTQLQKFFFYATFLFFFFGVSNTLSYMSTHI